MAPPSRSSIRRCAFKLPKNDKYQCPKAGDKYQLQVKLWYCRIHDRHASNRCQALVEWAGKGAQCEKLGYVNRGNGQRLCEWHAKKGGEVDGRQQQVRLNRQGEQCAAVGDVSVHRQQAKSEDDRESKDATTTATLSCLTVKTDLIDEGSSRSSTTTRPKLPSEERHEPTSSEREDQMTREPETMSDCSPSIHPSTPTERVIFNPPPVEDATDSKAKSNPHPPRDLKRPPHKRNDSLIPRTSPDISPAPSIPNTPPTPTNPPFLSPSSLYTPIPTIAPKPHPQPSRPRTTPTYAQCSVCLDKHGDYDMREVGGCKHRYRELCLRRAVKAGALRRFQCAGCREWMVGREEVLGRRVEVEV